MSWQYRETTKKSDTMIKWNKVLYFTSCALQNISILSAVNESSSRQELQDTKSTQSAA